MHTFNEHDVIENKKNTFTFCHGKNVKGKNK